MVEHRRGLTYEYKNHIDKRDWNQRAHWKNGFADNNSRRS